MKKIPDIIIEASRNLRKNMTDSEKILWNELKAKKLKNIKFGRQIPIYVFTENGGLDRYILPDFISRENKIIIELDGSIHNLKDIYELDKEKENLLLNLGYKILRFDNKEILTNLDKTLEKIAASFSGQGERIQVRGILTKA